MANDKEVTGRGRGYTTEELLEIWKHEALAYKEELDAVRKQVHRLESLVSQLESASESEEYRSRAVDSW